MGKYVMIVASRGRDVDSGGRQAMCLTPKRTDYGKAIRHDYESHMVYEQRKNMQQLEPRLDGITNTITTVLKDNLILEIWT